MLRTGWTVLCLWLLMSTVAWAGTPRGEMTIQSCEQVLAISNSWVNTNIFEAVQSMSEKECQLYFGRFTPSELRDLLSQGADFAIVHPDNGDIADPPASWVSPDIARAVDEDYTPLMRRGGAWATDWLVDVAYILIDAVSQLAYILVDVAAYMMNSLRA